MSNAPTYHVDRSASDLTQAVTSLGHDTEMGSVASYMDEAHLRVEHPDAQTVRIVLPGEKTEQDVSFDFIVTPGADERHADFRMVDHIPDDSGMKSDKGEAMTAKGIRETMRAEADELVKQLNAGRDPSEAAASMRMGLHALQVSHRQSTRDELARYKDPAVIHQVSEKAGTDYIDNDPNLTPDQRDKVKQALQQAEASQASQAAGQAPSQ